MVAGAWSRVGCAFPLVPFIFLVCPLRAASQGQPIVVNLGPLIDDLGLHLGDLPKEDAHHPNPLEVFEDQEQLFRGLLDHFGTHMLPAMQSGSRGFQTDVKGDHFRLRGTLPGYSMHRSSNGDEPLNVQVAGRTLVVQGSKSTGNMMTSFQRSFPLPWEPDPEKVAVTYGAQDGALLVDVTKKPGASTNPQQSAVRSDDIDLDPLALLSSPQMTMSFSDLGRGRSDRRSRSSLRGLPMIVGLSNPKAMLFQDPFEQFWNDMEPQIMLATPVDDAPENSDVVQAQMLETTKTTSQPRSSEPRSPVVVQPKNATPFWRLSSAESQRTKYIDIVSPPGIELGKIQGTSVEYFHTRGSDRKPQRLELPISVRAEDCMQNHMSSQEHVLRCHTHETVRNLHINVIDEL